MKKPHKRITSSMESGWVDYLQALEQSLQDLEQDIQEASEMADKCTSEWCEATEHVIDELSNALFSIHEPEFVSDENRKKLKQLKRRVHDLYARYKGVAA
jgi:uncharacterized coiled-coil protein SlyX